MLGFEVTPLFASETMSHSQTSEVTSEGDTIVRYKRLTCYQRVKKARALRVPRSS